MNPNMNPMMFPQNIPPIGAPSLNPLMLTPLQQMNLLNSYMEYCRLNGYDFNNQYIYNQYYQTYIMNMQNNNNPINPPFPPNPPVPSNPPFPTNPSFPPNPPFPPNPSFPPKPPVPPNPPITQIIPTCPTVVRYNVKKPQQVIPRPDYIDLKEKQNLNQTIYINCPDTNDNIINILFQANTGLQLLMSFSRNTTIKDILKAYMNKLQLSENYIGDQVIFLFSGNKLDKNSTNIIGNKYKDHMLITVIDQGGVIGAK